MPVSNFSQSEADFVWSGSPL